MTGLSEHDVFIFVSQLGVIILGARVCGLIAQKLGQPIIVGEVTAGILLGPSVFGKFFPGAFQTLFPSTGHHQFLLQGISWLCVLFLLLITGLEIDCRATIRHGRRTIMTALLSLGLPFIVLVLLGSFFPATYFPSEINPIHVKLMIATALSVVAIPVIAKILFDLKILRSFVGLNIITAGVISDVVGWSILAVIISLISTGEVTAVGVFKPLVLISIYLSVALYLGRGILDKIFDWLKIQVQEPATVMALLFSLALLNGAIAHMLGLHVILGAFIAGMMAGESERITPYLRQSVQDFIFGVFAPIFFVLIGMQLNLASIQNWPVVIIILLGVSVLKIGGATLGALLGGIGRRNALAVGCGLNTQGTMGVIVALIGMDYGVLNAETFTTIVFICIVTSLIVGPLLKWAMQGLRRPLADFFDRDHVFIDIEAKNKREAISAIAALMAERKIIKDADSISKAIWDREKSMSTAIGEGIALPHARVDNLDKPILCFFRLKNPVEFSAPDNRPVQLLFLELTDTNDDGMQLNLIAQVSRFVSRAKNRQKLLKFTKEDDIHQVLSFDERA